MVALSLLIALDVVLTRFFSIQTPLVRLSTNFIAIAITGALFGAIPAGIAAALADVIGMMLFPYGLFFPGFTLSAFLRGIIYGYFLHEKPVNIKSITISSILVSLGIGLGLTTLWLTMTQGVPYRELFITRIIPNGITLVLQVVILTTILPKIVTTGKKIIRA